jgi:hypothetical protein
MIYSLVFSLLSLISGYPDSKTESPKMQATFCNLAPGLVKISDFKNCNEVTLFAVPAVAQKYEGARVISYSFVISPKKSSTPPYVENVTGTAISENALDRVASLVSGDLIILTNVKIQTKTGTEDLKMKCGGSVYTIIAE